MFVAEELDTNLVNTTNGWSGIAFAYVTLGKGNNNHRVRVYGTDNIQDTLTAAWLTYTNGTILETLRISSVPNVHYITGNLRVNATVWNTLNNEQLVVVVASSKFPKGAIGGLLHSRPSTAIGFFSGAQVVGTVSNSTAVGIAYTYLYSTAFAAGLPVDLIQQDNAIVSGLQFKARALYNVPQSSVTSATFNGPANFTSNGPILVNLTNGNEVSFVTAFTPVTTDFFSPGTGNAYIQVNTQARPNGEIRADLFPTLALTRRAIPYAVEAVDGSFSAPNGLATLRYANQVGNEKNFGSFVSIVSTQDTPGANWTAQVLFKFPAATSRRNFNLVRALSIELNLRLFGTGTWAFDWFDSTTGGYVSAATFSTAGLWTSGFADYFGVNANTFTNSRGQLVVRVSVNSAVATTLWIDLFGIRSYEPNSFTNQFLKPAIETIDTLPVV